MPAGLESRVTNLNRELKRNTKEEGPEVVHLREELLPAITFDANGGVISLGSAVVEANDGRVGVGCLGGDRRFAVGPTGNLSTIPRSR